MQPIKSVIKTGVYFHAIGLDDMMKAPGWFSVAKRDIEFLCGNDTDIPFDPSDTHEDRLNLQPYNEDLAERVESGEVGIWKPGSDSEDEPEDSDPEFTKWWFKKLDEQRRAEAKSKPASSSRGEGASSSTFVPRTPSPKRTLRPATPSPKDDEPTQNMEQNEEEVDYDEP